MLEGGGIEEGEKEKWGDDGKSIQSFSLTSAESQFYSIVPIPTRMYCTHKIF